MASIIYNIGFKTDTSGVESAINKLKSQMDAAFSQSIKFGPDMESQINAAAKSATVLQGAMEKAMTTRGTSFITLNTELEKAGESMSSIVNNFASAGMHEAADDFLNMWMTSNRQAVTLNSKIQEMARVMTQSFKYMASQQVFNFINQQIASGVAYTKQMNAALTDIQIVTGETAAGMDRIYADIKAGAQEIGIAAKEYADAALIFYQQGLGDSDVAELTETTLKAAKVAGEGVAQMSSELTTIQRNFKMTNEELNNAASIGARLGAETAVDFAYIAEAMQPTAQAAAELGLSYESLGAVIATVGETSQQSASVVGNAFKTIFSRFANLKATGEDEGVTLGQITANFQKMGIEVLDAAGELKDLETIINDIGGKWDTYSVKQQQAIAQIAGGTRQYVQFLTLMNNFSRYQELQNSALDEQNGETLAKQYKIWGDSIEALAARSREAWASAFGSIFSEDVIKTFYKVLEDLGKVFNNLITGMGGFKGIALTIAQIFSQQWSAGLASSLLTLKNMAKQSTLNGRITQSNLALDKAIADAELLGNTEMAEKLRFAREYNSEMIKLQQLQKSSNLEVVSGAQAGIDRLSQLQQQYDMQTNIAAQAQEAIRAEASLLDERILANDKILEEEKNAEQLNELQQQQIELTNQLSAAQQKVTEAEQEQLAAREALNNAQKAVNAVTNREAGLASGTGKDAETGRIGSQMVSRQDREEILKPNLQEQQQVFDQIDEKLKAAKAEVQKFDEELQKVNKTAASINFNAAKIPVDQINQDIQSISTQLAPLSISGADDIINQLKAAAAGLGESVNLVDGVGAYERIQEILKLYNQLQGIVNPISLQQAQGSINEIMASFSSLKNSVQPLNSEAANVIADQIKSKLVDLDALLLKMDDSEAKSKLLAFKAEAENTLSTLQLNTAEAEAKIQNIKSDLETQTIQMRIQAELSEISRVQDLIKGISGDISMNSNLDTIISRLEQAAQLTSTLSGHSMIFNLEGLSGLSTAFADIQAAEERIKNIDITAALKGQEQVNAQLDQIISKNGTVITADIIAKLHTEAFADQIKAEVQNISAIEIPANIRKEGIRQSVSEIRDEIKSLNTLDIAANTKEAEERFIKLTGLVDKLKEKLNDESITFKSKDALRSSLEEVSAALSKTFDKSYKLNIDTAALTSFEEKIGAVSDLAVELKINSSEEGLAAFLEKLSELKNFDFKGIDPAVADKMKAQIAEFNNLAIKISSTFDNSGIIEYNEAKSKLEGANTKITTTLEDLASKDLAQIIENVPKEVTVKISAEADAVPIDQFKEKISDISGTVAKAKIDVDDAEGKAKLAEFQIKEKELTDIIVKLKADPSEENITAFQKALQSFKDVSVAVLPRLNEEAKVKLDEQLQSIKDVTVNVTPSVNAQAITVLQDQLKTFKDSSFEITGRAKIEGIDQVEAQLNKIKEAVNIQFTGDQDNPLFKQIQEKITELENTKVKLGLTTDAADFAAVKQQFEAQAKELNDLMQIKATGTATIGGIGDLNSSLTNLKAEIQVRLDADPANQQLVELQQKVEKSLEITTKLTGEVDSATFGKLKEELDKELADIEKINNTPIKPSFDSSSATNFLRQFGEDLNKVITLGSKSTPFKDLSAEAQKFKNILFEVSSGKKDVSDLNKAFSDFSATLANVGKSNSLPELNTAIENTKDSVTFLNERVNSVNPAPIADLKDSIEGVATAAKSLNFTDAGMTLNVDTSQLAAAKEAAEGVLSALSNVTFTPEIDNQAITKFKDEIANLPKITAESDVSELENFLKKVGELKDKAINLKVNAEDADKIEKIREELTSLEILANEGITLKSDTQNAEQNLEKVADKATEIQTKINSLQSKDLELTVSSNSDSVIDRIVSNLQGLSDTLINVKVDGADEVKQNIDSLISELNNKKAIGVPLTVDDAAEFNKRINDAVASANNLLVEVPVTPKMDEVAQRTAAEQLKNSFNESIVKLEVAINEGDKEKINTVFQEIIGKAKELKANLQVGVDDEKIKQLDLFIKELNDQKINVDFNLANTIDTSGIKEKMTAAIDQVAADIPPITQSVVPTVDNAALQAAKAEFNSLFAELSEAISIGADSSKIDNLLNQIKAKAEGMTIDTRLTSSVDQSSLENAKSTILNTVNTISENLKPTVTPQVQTSDFESQIKEISRLMTETMTAPNNTVNDLAKGILDAADVLSNSFKSTSDEGKKLNDALLIVKQAASQLFSTIMRNGGAAPQVFDLLNRALKNVESEFQKVSSSASSGLTTQPTTTVTVEADTSKAQAAVETLSTTVNNIGAIPTTVNMDTTQAAQGMQSLTDAAAAAMASIGAASSAAESLKSTATGMPKVEMITDEQVAKTQEEVAKHQELQKEYQKEIDLLNKKLSENKLILEEAQRQKELIEQNRDLAMQQAKPQDLSMPVPDISELNKQLQDYNRLIEEGNRGSQAGSQAVQQQVAAQQQNLTAAKQVLETEQQKLVTMQQEAQYIVNSGQSYDPTAIQAQLAAQQQIVQSKQEEVNLAQSAFEAAQAQVAISSPQQAQTAAIYEMKKKAVEEDIKNVDAITKINSLLKSASTAQVEEAKASKEQLELLIKRRDNLIQQNVNYKNLKKSAEDILSTELNINKAEQNVLQSSLKDIDVKNQSAEAVKQQVTAIEGISEKIKSLPAEQIVKIIEEVQRVNAAEEGEASTGEELTNVIQQTEQLRTSVQDMQVRVPTLGQAFEQAFGKISLEQGLQQISSFTLGLARLGNSVSTISKMISGETEMTFSGFAMALGMGVQQVSALGKQFISVIPKIVAFIGAKAGISAANIVETGTWNALTIAETLALWPIQLILVAILAILAVIFIFINAQKSAAEAAKKNAEATSEHVEKLKEQEQAINDTNSAIDDLTQKYREAYEAGEDYNDTLVELKKKLEEVRQQYADSGVDEQILAELREAEAVALVTQNWEEYLKVREKADAAVDKTVAEAAKADANAQVQAAKYAFAEDGGNVSGNRHVGDVGRYNTETSKLMKEYEDIFQGATGVAESATFHIDFDKGATEFLKDYERALEFVDKAGLTGENSDVIREVNLELEAMADYYQKIKDNEDLIAQADFLDRIKAAREALTGKGEDIIFDAEDVTDVDSYNAAVEQLTEQLWTADQAIEDESQRLYENREAAEAAAEAYLVSSEGLGTYATQAAALDVRLEQLRRAQSMPEIQVDPEAMKELEGLEDQYKAAKEELQLLQEQVEKGLDTSFEEAFYDATDAVMAMQDTIAFTGELTAEQEQQFKILATNFGKTEEEIAQALEGIKTGRFNAVDFFDFESFSEANAVIDIAIQKAQTKVNIYESHMLALRNEINGVASAVYAWNSSIEQNEADIERAEGVFKKWMEGLSDEDLSYSMRIDFKDLDISKDNIEQQLNALLSKVKIAEKLSVPVEIEGTWTEDDEKAIGIDIATFDAYADTLLEVEAAEYDVNAAAVIAVKGNEKLNTAFKRSTEQLVKSAKALNNLKTVFDDNIDVLQKFIDGADLSEGELLDLSVAITAVKEAGDQLLGVDTETLSDGFYQDTVNLKLLQEAAAGSAEALDNLRTAAAQDMIVQATVNLDTTAKDRIQGYFDELAAEADSFKDIAPGFRIETSGADESVAHVRELLRKLVEEEGMAAEAVQAIGKQIGYDVELEVKPVTMTSKVPVIVTETEQVYEEQEIPFPAAAAGLLAMSGMPIPSLGTRMVPGKMRSWSYQDGTTDVEETKMVATIGEGSLITRTAPAEKVVATSKATTLGGGKSKDTGKGGSSSGSVKKVEIPEIDTEPMVERYADITAALEEQANVLDKISKLEDSAYGTSKQALIRAYGKNILKQAALQTKYLKEIDEYQVKDQAALSEFAALEFEGFKVEFNTDGAIANLEELYEAYNKRIEQAKAKQQEMLGDLDTTYEAVFAENEALAAQGDEVAKQKIEAAQEALELVTNSEAFQNVADVIDKLEEKIKELVSQVNETAQLKQTELMEQYDNIIDFIQQRIDSALYLRELRIEINETDLKIAELLMRKYAQNTANAARSMKDMAAASENLVQNGQLMLGAVQRLQEVGNNLTDPNMENWFVNEAFNGEGFGQEAWDMYKQTGEFDASVMEKLVEYQDKMIDLTNELYDTNEEMWDKYIQTMQDVSDELSRQVDKLNTAKQIVDDLASIWEGMGGYYADTTTTLDLMETGAEALTESLIAYKGTYDVLAENAARAKADYEAALMRPEIDDATLNQFKVAMETAEDLATEALTNFTGAASDLVAAFAEYAEQTAEIISYNMQKSLNGIFSQLDEALELYDMIEYNEDFYVDQVNKVYNLDSMINDLQKMMEASDNPKAVQVLQKRIEELNAKREEGVELTQTDLDIIAKENELIELQIQLEEQQAAAQDARAAKNTMKLMRDASGNYAYVYAADDTAEKEAEDIAQKIKDVENEIYNLNRNAAKEMSKLWLQTYTEYIHFEESVDQARMEYDEKYRIWVENIRVQYQEKLDLIEAKIIQHNEAIDQAFDQTVLGLTTDYNSMAQLGNDYEAAHDQMVQELEANYKKWQNASKTALEACGVDVKNLSATMQTYTALIRQYIRATADEFTTLKQASSAVLQQTNTEINSWVNNWTTNLKTLMDALQAAIDKLQEFRKELAGGDVEIGDDLTNGIGGTPLTDTSTTAKGYDPNKDYAAAIGQMIRNALNLSVDANGNETKTTAQVFDELKYNTEFQKLWAERKAKIEDLGLQNSYSNEALAAMLSGGVTWKDGGWYTWDSANGKYVRYYGMKSYAAGGYVTEHQVAEIGEAGNELVLNPEDTVNILKAVREIREVQEVQLDDKVSYTVKTLAAEVASYLTQLRYGIELPDTETVTEVNKSMTENNNVTQEISINAEFPNVSVAQEIEMAFANLANQAVQYAASKR